MTLRESFKQVLTSNFQRQTDNIEKAITVTSLGGGRAETEAIVGGADHSGVVQFAYLDHAIDLWNSHVDAIDRKFGKGWFNIRLRRENAFTFQFMTLAKPRISVPLRKKPEAWWATASVKLDYLLATDPKPAYQWMSDMLTLAVLSEKEVQHQATARDGFWNRVLRKRKSAIELKQAAADHDAALVLKDDQRRQKVRTERRDALARHKKLEQLILEAGDKEIAVNWAHAYIADPETGAGRLVPLSPRQAQNSPSRNPRAAPKANPDNRVDPKGKGMGHTMRRLGGLDKK